MQAFKVLLDPDLGELGMRLWIDADDIRAGGPVEPGDRGRRRSPAAFRYPTVTRRDNFIPLP